MFGIFTQSKISVGRGHRDIETFQGIVDDKDKAGGIIADMAKMAEAGVTWICREVGILNGTADLPQFKAAETQANVKAKLATLALSTEELTALASMLNAKPIPKPKTETPATAPATANVGTVEPLAPTIAPAPSPAMTEADAGVSDATEADLAGTLAQGEEIFNAD
jgi:hypothetical protein